MVAQPLEHTVAVVTGTGSAIEHDRSITGKEAPASGKRLLEVLERERNRPRDMAPAKDGFRPHIDNHRASVPGQHAHLLERKEFRRRRIVSILPRRGDAIARLAGGRPGKEPCHHNGENEQTKGAAEIA